MPTTSAENRGDTPRIGRRRKMVFAVLLAAALALLLELLSWTGLRIVTGGWPSRAELADERAATAGHASRLGRTGAMRRTRRLAGAYDELALHPFLGFVVDPTAERPGRGRHDPRSAELGFPDNVSDLLQGRGPDRVVVGVFGGSVANILAVSHLPAELARVPRFAGRRVVVVSMALGGYKQPQQLLALNYLLLLGGELDVAVNVDGFNEVALPPADLDPWGIFPLYPRAWLYRTAGLEPKLRRAVGLVTWLEERRRSRAAFFSRPPWDRSLTATLVWKLLDLRLEAEIARSHAVLQGEGVVAKGYQSRGPKSKRVFAGELPAAIAATWRQASLQMHKLCAANGIEYYHFLQPNQYVAGSKPLSPEERRTALNVASPYRQGVLEGYPLLAAEGERLRREGVEFHDLTTLFSDVRETLYMDDCCHYNREGNRLVAAALAGVVARPPGVRR